MSDYPTFSVHVPKGFEPRFASIFRPTAMPGVNAPPKHSCCFPASELPQGHEDWLGSYMPHRGWVPLARPWPREEPATHIAAARSNIAPLVVPGLVKGQEKWWQHQLEQCDAHNLPRDWLFRFLRLELVVQPMDWDRRAFGTRMHGVLLNLKAVVVCDPSDTEPLERLVAETRKTAAEGRKR